MGIFSFNASSSAHEKCPDADRRQMLRMACACCLMPALPLSAAAAESAEVQRHLEAARQAAGSDLGAYFKLGQVAAPTPGAVQMSPEDRKSVV